MKVYALSDIHVDYPENLQWLLSIDDELYQQDVMILAGDVSDNIDLLRQVFVSLKSKFREVLFVPGNHELWVHNDEVDCSLLKFDLIQSLCRELGVRDSLFEHEEISFVPLLSWYDFSFGEPDRHLRRAWRDFKACSWPNHLQDSQSISEHFLEQNIPLLDTRNRFVISFSHFVPRIDVMPERIPLDRRRVYPVLGASDLGDQIARLNPDVHVYGHSHVNQSITLDDIHFVNNAFAYPAEQRIARKRLHCIFDLDEARSNAA
jgi:predicted phosphodiesterase